MKNTKYLVAMAAFATLALVGFSAFTTEPNGVKPTVAGTEVLATREAARNEFPFMVVITVDGGWSRGWGILISPEWVLTSAALLNGSSAADLVFGMHNLQGLWDESEPASVKVHVTANDITLHESWNSNSLDNNLALIRLPAPLTLSPAIQPLHAVDWTENWVGQTAKSIGWGMYLENNVIKTTNLPQVVDISMIAMSQANTVLGKSYHPSHHIAGDTQGAAYSTSVVVTTGTGSTKLVGFCNEGILGNSIAVYSRLDHFSVWIEQNSGIGFN